MKIRKDFTTASWFYDLWTALGVFVSVSALIARILTMCRFVAYLGKKPILLSEFVEKPGHSLIRQSRHAKEIQCGLNADGFGLGWYDFGVDSKPGVYRSIQPAWSDENLRHIAGKIRSTCFIAHVRASTVGDVNFYNCHPFSMGNYLFAHNGTIREFTQLKRELLNALSEETFLQVRGQTDSEHFFALIYDQLREQTKPGSQAMEQAMRQVIQRVIAWQENFSETCFSRLNTVLTDGHSLIATRYATRGQTPLSLYYTQGLSCMSQAGPFVLVASEPLTEKKEEWHAVPENHVLVVTEDLDLRVELL